MTHTKILSYRFDMSTGVAPVLMCQLPSGIIGHEAAIYLGAGVALLATLLRETKRGIHLPHFILYGTTMMLLLVSIFHLFGSCYCPPQLQSLAVELAVLLPPLLIWSNKKWLPGKSKRCATAEQRLLFAHGVESAVVASRVVLLMAGLQLVVTLLLLMLLRPQTPASRFFLCQCLPPATILAAMLFNRMGIHFFNRVMRQTVFLPIVNKQGDVVGRCLAEDALRHKTRFINPVVRIAVSAHGMLYLRPRFPEQIPEAGRHDIAVEDYLHFGETLDEAVSRILTGQLPDAPADELRFHLMYHFENGVSNRLVYLYSLTLPDEFLLRNGQIKGGKLWTFRQISQNMDKNFLSSFLEYEFEELKEIIYTREKYREPSSGRASRPATLSQSSS